ncbi:hypothetical protein B566_EDAN018839, partial [Ephemera danica]
MICANPEGEMELPVDDSFPPTALIEFGEHILTSFKNNELKFQCKPGYELNGNSFVECINGTRKADIPKC